MTVPHGRLDVIYVGTLPPHPGGSAISSSQLILGFARLGHEVRALSPITPEALSAGDCFAKSHPEIAVTRFEVPYFETSPDRSPPADYRTLEHEQIEKWLPEMIAQQRPDVIFIGRESFAWHVPDIAQTWGVPTVQRIAGGTIGSVLAQTYPEAQRRELLQQLSKVDLIVTPAAHLLDGLRALTGRNIKTVANAVDLRQFAPAPKDAGLLRELGIPSDEVVAIHVSNLKAIKRPQDVVLSAERALQHNPKLVYVVVGDGVCRQSMEDLCAERHLSGRFRFVGWIDYARLPRYMNLADFVIMPSESEGLSRVYLEAQACARLLLASDIPAAREVITDGETGVLFRTGDVESLTRKTLMLAADPELRTRIGRRACQRVSAHAIEHAVDAYLDLIGSLVRQHRGDR